MSSSLKFSEGTKTALAKVTERLAERGIHHDFSESAVKDYQATEASCLEQALDILCWHVKHTPRV